LLRQRRLPGVKARRQRRERHASRDSPVRARHVGRESGQPRYLVALLALARGESPRTVDEAPNADPGEFAALEAPRAAVARDQVFTSISADPDVGVAGPRRPGRIE